MGVGRSLDLQPLKRLPLELSYLSDWAPSYPTRLPLDCCAVDKQFKTLKEADDSRKEDMVKELKGEWEKVKAERKKQYRDQLKTWKATASALLKLKK